MKKSYFARDNEGFWVAYIEEEPDTPENHGIGTVRRRQTLPVPPSATRDEAERAFLRLMSRVRLMSREARCNHGRR